jgi:hypothetical protein
MVSLPHDARGRKTRRPRGRSDERGATMFIVLMVLMILSAIGTFALSTARYEVQSAGYRRQRAQAQEAANFGGAAAQTSMDPKHVKFYVDQLYASRELCPEQSVPAGGACYHIIAADIERVALPSGEKLFVLPNSSTTSPEGSYGLAGTNADTVNGGFSVALTEPAELQRPVAGWGSDPSGNAVRFLDLTVTSMGAVFSDPNQNGVVDASERPGAAFASARGHVILGPVLN